MDSVGKLERAIASSRAESMPGKSKREKRPAAPTVVSPPGVRVVEACVLAGIFGALLTPLIYTEATIYPFVYPKVLFFQTVVDLTFPAWLALALRDRRFRPRPSGLLWSMLGWTLATIVATCFAENPRHSLFSTPERMAGLGPQLHVLAWFVMATGTLKTARRRDRLLFAQLAVAVACAVIAIAQTVAPSLLGMGAVSDGSRLSGTLGNPIYLGGYELFAIFFALMFVGRVRGGRRALLLLSAFAAIGAIVLAGSRGPMLGLFAGIAVTGIALGIAGRHRKWVVATTASLLAVAATYGAIVALVANRPSMEPFWDRHENLRHIFLFSETARLQLWTAAWDGFLRRPLLGWGLGGYEAAFDVVFRPAFHPLRYQDRAHNVLLGALCETGALGATAYLAMWVSFAVAAVRAARTEALTWVQGAALLGAGAGYFVYSFFAPEGIATDLMVTVTFAVVAVSGTAEPSERDEAIKPIGPKRLIILGIASATSLAILWFGSLSPFLASNFAKKAMSEAASSNGDQLIAWLDDARRFRTPYVDDKLAAVIGIAEESVRADSVRTSSQKETLVRLALEMASEYLHAYPTHARYRTQLADSLVTLGRGSGRKEMEAQAERLYLQSIAESPKRQMYRFAYATFLTKSGRQDEAEEQYRMAFAAAPRMGKALWSLGRFLWSVRGQVEEGSRMMTASIEVAEYDRFWPESPLEWLQLAEALAKQQRTDLLRGLLTSLRRLPTNPRSAKACVEIAKVMEDSGLLTERDQLLQLAINRNASLGTTLGEVLVGRARLRDSGRKVAAP